MRKAAVLIAITWVGCSSDNPPAPDMSTPDLSSTTTPDSGGMHCDVVTQNCQTGKCSTVEMGSMQNPTLNTICVPEVGPNTNGQTCTRSALGHDDCAKGLICTLAGTANGTFECVELCHADADCTGGRKCAQLDPMFPDNGFCLKPCTLLGTDCPSGMTCSDLRFDMASTNQNPLPFPICRSLGTVAIGATCMTETDCVANAVCDIDSSGMALACFSLCDADHLCPGDDGGGACVDEGLPNGGGECNALP